MTLNWSSVKSEHVEAAFEILKVKMGRTKRQGLVVSYKELVFPAKDVLRVAYRIANSLPDDVKIKFSSGDGTLHILRRLGFEAQRLP